MNSFASQPPMIEPQPITVRYGGILVQKDKVLNIQQREMIRKRCDADPAFRQQTMMLCAQSFPLWVNLFAWSFSVFKTENGITEQATTTIEPFITWRKQDEWMELACESLLTGKSLLTDKSRDVGATWLHLLLFVWYFLFHKQRQLIVLSYREDEIDQLAGEVSKRFPEVISSDKGTLFGKLDHILHYLPAWMTPRMERKRLHLVNLDNGSRIDGESTTEQATRSDRRHAIFLDEFAMVEAKKASGIRTGSANVALSRFVCSTPQGLGTEFARWRHSGSIPTFSIGWWEMPGKNDGLEIMAGPDGRFKYSSPWYRAECQKMGDPQTIATELDIDYIASGAPFFDSAMIDAYAKINVRDPVLRLKIAFREDVPEAHIPMLISRKDRTKIKVTVDPKGEWLFWVLPGVKNDLAKEGEYAFQFPTDTRLYFGIDISLGMGASNSVCSVLRSRSREKIAEYVSAHKPPYAFAKDLIAAALWFSAGGLRPTMVPEINGNGGIDFLRQMSQVYKYPDIYRAKSLGEIVEKQSETLGFHSSKQKKAVLLGNLRRQYAVGRFTNHSKRSLDEAKDYITYPNGSIGPAALFAESEEARATHGDRVIADALACWPGQEIEAYREEKSPGSPLDAVHLAPYGSQGYRIAHKETSYKAFQKKKNLRDVPFHGRIRFKDYS